LKSKKNKLPLQDGNGQLELELELELKLLSNQADSSKAVTGLHSEQTPMLQIAFAGWLRTTSMASGLCTVS
jgi:hypothetical protein